jgi:hypothetical protein
MRTRSFIAVLALLTTFLAPAINRAYAVSVLPSAPLSVTQSAISVGVRVGWSAPTDVATGITGYKIEKSTDGSTGWSEVGSVSGSTYTYDILNLPQSAVYVRVAATASGGTGTYGYKWTKIYGTTSMNRNSGDGSINYETGYGIAAGDVSKTIGTPSFSRVRYRMSVTVNSVANYAETDFYKWSSASITTLAIPVLDASPLVVQTNVTDLNTYSDNANVTKGKALSGRLEIWPYNYANTASGLFSPIPASTVYDYDDTVNNNGGYGSFQVHDITNSKTVFAWNLHQYGSTPNIGFGNAPSGDPDWTFCTSICASPSNFYLQIFINESVTPLVGNSTSTISIPTTGTKRLAMTLSATSNLVGYFTFYWKGKKISGCAKKATAASAPYTATCSWKPSLPGLQNITATFSNAAAGYTTSTASANTTIARRTGNR